MNSYVCLVCGYVHFGDEPPESCPICAAPKESFELVKAVEEEMKTNAYRCLNCEFVHEGDAPPDICPICGMSHEHFEGIEEKPIQVIDSSIKNVLILGGGIAAVTAAETLREMDDHIQITMITNEQKLPYYRLNLTRYLCNEIVEGDLCIHPQYWFDKMCINVFINRIVTDINREEQVVSTADGLKVGYDRLIIALGSHAFIPPIKGISQPGISTLRSLEDAKELKENIGQGTKVFVIGGGVLGLEVAGALSSVGAKITVGEGSKWLMPRQLNEEASVYVEKSLGRKGIEVEYEFRTLEIVKSEDGFELKSADGRSVIVDRVIVATGVRPNTYLARKAELEVNRGLVVNNHLRTSDEKIFAVGDITEHYGVAYGLWNIAQFQGKIAAMNILGVKADFGGVPRSNALKVLDIDLFSIGEIGCQDASSYCVEKKDEDKYISFIIRDGVIVGSIAIGYKMITHKIKKAVENGQNISVGGAVDTDEILRIID